MFAICWPPSNGRRLLAAYCWLPLVGRLQLAACWPPALAADSVRLLTACDWPPSADCLHLAASCLPTTAGHPQLATYCWPPAAGCLLLAAYYWLPHPADCRILLAADCWPYTAGRRLMAADFWPRTAGRLPLAPAIGRQSPAGCYWPSAADRLRLTAYVSPLASGPRTTGRLLTTIGRLRLAASYQPPTGRLVLAACYWPTTAGRLMLPAKNRPPTAGGLLLAAYYRPPHLVKLAAHVEEHGTNLAGRCMDITCGFSCPIGSRPHLTPSHTSAVPGLHRDSTRTSPGYSYDDTPVLCGDIATPKTSTSEAKCICRASAAPRQSHSIGAIRRSAGCS